MSKRCVSVEERSYGGWFFIAVICMALVMGWAIYDEAVTRRPWKKYQNRFFQMELERVEGELEDARRGLADPETARKLERLDEKIEAARARLEGPEYTEAKRRLEKKERLKNSLRQELVFLRSERDEAYYFWKESLHRDAEDSGWKRRYQWLVDQVEAKEAKLEEQERELREARQAVRSLNEELAGLLEQRRRMTARRDELLEKRKKIRRKRPHVRQFVLPQMDTVDRCTTCHLAVDRPGFDGPEVKEPFRTHPRREALLGGVHPPGRFGCTACHRGQGPQTKGVAGRPFDHGRNDPYWERPMLDKPFTQATCRGCHPEEWELEGAPVLSRGRVLYARLGCYACHLSAGWEDARMIGPSLTRIAAKAGKDWLVAWLRDPKELRPRTRMPVFWPALARGGETGDKEESEREAGAVAAFYFEASLGGLAVEGPGMEQTDSARGRALFIDRGCTGCHRPEALDLPPLENGQDPWQYGPDLDYLGSKVSGEWISSFLLHPEQWSSQGRMPDMKLSSRDAADLAAFLAGLERERPFPEPVGLDQPGLAKLGRELVSYYGCYNCHQSPGFESDVRVGPDLDGFGDKPPHLLAFGDTVTDPAEQTWKRWTRIKLESPRIFQTEKIALKMPDYEHPPEHIEPLMVYLRSLFQKPQNPANLRRLSGVEKGAAAGAWLADQYNCRGCHVIGERGGDVRLMIADPGQAPPDLTNEGAKVQPSWLFQFLKKPEVLRPWMNMKMPDFGFTDQKADQLVKYFMKLAEKRALFVELPVEMPPGLMKETAEAFVELKCLQCHQLTAGPEVTLSDLAPDMALTRHRLRPDWMEQFIYDPQSLQPGTRMPTYFPLEDDEDPDSIMTPLPDWLGGDAVPQVRAIRDYLYLLKDQASIEGEAKRAAGEKAGME